MNERFKELDHFGGFYQYISQFPNLQQLNFQQESIPNPFFRKPPILVDFYLPLLIENNKNLDTIRVDGICQFITACDTTRLAANLNVANRRSMKLIGIRCLKTMDLATLMFIKDKLDIETLPTLAEMEYNDDSGLTEIICKFDEDPNTVFKQLDNNRQNLKGWICVGLKYGNSTFYHPAPTPQRRL